jgi:proteasome accessory factor B
MIRIHEAIQSGGYPNATRLGRELEVSTKSIHRDLDFMRDRLNLPLAYHPQRFGYHYTEAVSAFPTLQITEGELFALLIAEKSLQQYRGTHFERPLVSAFKKLAAALPDAISLHLADWSATEKKGVPIGKGVVDWKNLFTAAKLGGVKNYFVEMDLDAFKPSSEYLRDLKV